MSLGLSERRGEVTGNGGEEVGGEVGAADKALVASAGPTSVRARVRAKYNT
jgi:hypothetical protein